MEKPTSIDDLAILASTKVSEAEKDLALHRLLTRYRGFWTKRSKAHNATLIESLVARSWYYTAMFLGADYAAAALLEPELLAYDAIFILRERGCTATNPDAWFTGLIKNLIQDEIRRASPIIFGYEKFSGLTAPSRSQTEAATRKSQGKFYKDLNKVLESLSPKNRAVVALWIDGLNHGEIAKQLGIRESTSRKRLSRGLQTLRAIVDDIDLPTLPDDHEETFRRPKTSQQDRPRSPKQYND